MRRLLPTLLALGLLACGRSDRPSPAPEASSAPLEAGPGVRELLGGLAPGDPLGAAQVSFIGAVQQGHIPILLRKGDSTGKIAINKLSDTSALPPVKTGKYAIYFTTPHPGSTSISQGDLTAACEALAERLRATEDKIAVPAGVTSYGPVSEEM
jgi:hypothetical protein